MCAVFMPYGPKKKKSRLWIRPMFITGLLEVITPLQNNFLVLLHNILFSNLHSLSLSIVSRDCVFCLLSFIALSWIKIYSGFAPVPYDSGFDDTCMMRANQETGRCWQSRTMTVVIRQISCFRARMGRFSMFLCANLYAAKRGCHSSGSNTVP
jgi:hypothetical protein